jgi:hypothetical protein
VGYAVRTSAREGEDSRRFILVRKRSEAPTGVNDTKNKYI